MYGPEWFSEPLKFSISVAAWLRGGDPYITKDYMRLLMDSDCLIKIIIASLETDPTGVLYSYDKGFDRYAITRREPWSRPIRSSGPADESKRTFC